METFYFSLPEPGGRGNDLSPLKGPPLPPPPPPPPLGDKAASRFTGPDWRAAATDHRTDWWEIDEMRR